MLKKDEEYKLTKKKNQIKCCVKAMLTINGLNN